MNDTRWFVSYQARPAANLRLICFPYAGAGPSAFRHWIGLLPKSIDIVCALLPGRGLRMHESPSTDVAYVTRGLCDGIAAYLDRPFAFFGHSLGSMFAFEVSRELRRRGMPQPAYAFFSGRRAPHLLNDEEHIHALPDAQFKQKLAEFNGTPHEILENEELMTLLLPILRADIGMSETYQYSEDRPLEFPIAALGGLQDADLSRDQLQAWARHTTAAFSLHMFPGDHFFVNSACDLLLRLIAEKLTQVASVHR
jgi:medium-chain acyl-[acyl-carrier-protein] hydrolase